MLVMWDRGFHDFDMFQGVLQRQAHALGRLPAHVKPKHVRTLPDGSYLAYIYPSDYRRRRRGERLLLRIVEYTLTGTTITGFGEIHRLATTLLDYQRCSAVDLACCYHERWEIEVVIDEVDDHQRLAGRPLQSLKPVGVIQELYGLLIAHYAVRFTMHEAAHLAAIDPDRLSFTHALQVIQDAISEFQMTAPELLSQLYQRMLRDIAAERLPERHSAPTHGSSSARCPSSISNGRNTVTGRSPLAVPEGCGPYLKGIAPKPFTLDFRTIR